MKLKRLATNKLRKFIAKEEGLIETLEELVEETKFAKKVLTVRFRTS